MIATCDYCGNEFDKETKEYNRAKRLNRKIFCSVNCMKLGKRNSNKGGKANNNKSASLAASKSRRKKIEILAVELDISTEDYIGLRETVRRVKNRNKLPSRIERNITNDVPEIKDLAQLWKNQKGICPFTGWILTLPTLYDKATPKTASLDRIDNTKGYELNNIRFVSVMVNYAKNGFGEVELSDFIKAIREV